MKNFHKKAQDRIDSYCPEGGLDTSSRLFLHMAAVRHPEVRDHCERVGLLAEAVALKLQKDPKAAFFAGILHDIGKTLMPSDLFDGHNISSDEYALVKEHAYDGFSILKDMHLFTALVCGSHHAMYKAGYGVEQGDFPEEWGLATVKKLLETSVIVSVCDFVDAFMNRTTTIKDGTKGPTLKEMLENKYPDDHLVVSTALKAAHYKEPPKEKAGVVWSDEIVDNELLRYWEGTLQNGGKMPPLRMWNGLTGHLSQVWAFEWETGFEGMARWRTHIEDQWATRGNTIRTWSTLERAQKAATQSRRVRMPRALQIQEEPPCPTA